MTFKNHSSNILVYGAPKSGTTLTLRLLDSQYILSHPTEVKIKDFDYLISKIRSRNINDQIKNKFFNMGKKKLNQTELKFLNKKIFYIKNLNDYILLTLDLFKMIYGIKKKKRYLIKEVGGNPNKIISDFFSVSPKGLVVAVIRNPVNTSYALFDHYKKTNFNQFKIFKSVAKNFINNYLLLKECRKRKNDSRFYIFSYEKIIENPSLFFKDCFKFNIIPKKTKQKITQNGLPYKVDTASVKRSSHKVFRKKLNLKKFNKFERIFVKLLSLIFKNTVNDIKNSINNSKNTFLKIS